MTSPLRVTPVSLRELAQRCAALAEGVAPAPPAVTRCGWQTSSTATSSVNAGGSKAAAAMRGRTAAYLKYPGD